MQAELMNLTDYPPYMALSDKQKREYWMHNNAWSLSQFLHGNRLPAGCIPTCSCAPTLNANLYALADI
ncbi:MAG: hypothetical protein ACE37N_08995 [Pseudohongiellaceae bacterium]